MTYEVNYTLSFVLFWGFGLGAAYFCGGLLSLATAAVVLLMLVHHEHAHLKEIERRSASVNSMTFGAFGGLIDMADYYPLDEVEIHKAGIVNSACYAAYFLILLVIITFIGTEMHWNFADSAPLGLLYWMQFIRSLSLSAVVLVATNIAPIWWRTRKYGVVTTDGMEIYRKIELGNELWNDGKTLAAAVSFY